MVFLFVLLCCFTTDIKLKQAQYIHPYIIQENFRPIRTFLFGIYSLLFFPLVPSLFHSFSSFFLSVFPKDIVLLHSLLQETQKVQYHNVALFVVLKEIFSSCDHRHINLKVFAVCYKYAWATTASVMTCMRVTARTCFLL